MSSAHQIARSEQIAKYLRKVLAATKLDQASSERVVEALVPRIKRMVVWDKPQASIVVTAEGPIDAAAPTVAAVEPLSVLADNVNAATEVPPFDPYAFSAVVALSKSGRDGLMKKLAAVEHVAHLRQLAEAQHLAVDAGAMKTAEEWRRAILDAAAERIANRRAAAS